MSPTGKNLIVVLGIVTIVFAGYYLMTQSGQTGFIRDSQSEQLLADLRRDVDEFVGYGATLNATQLNVDLFDRPEFIRLQDFSDKPNKFLVGRENPFVDALPEQPLETDDDSAPFQSFNNEQSAN